MTGVVALLTAAGNRFSGRIRRRVSRGQQNMPSKIMLDVNRCDELSMIGDTLRVPVAKTFGRVSLPG